MSTAEPVCDICGEAIAPDAPTVDCGWGPEHVCCHHRDLALGREADREAELEEAARAERLPPTSQPETA